jgi:hypothetical protein
MGGEQNTGNPQPGLRSPAGAKLNEPSQVKRGELLRKGNVQK